MQAAGKAIMRGEGGEGRHGKGEPAPAPGPTPALPVTIEYGGSSHGDAAHDGNVLARPEAVRSEACANGVCQDCTEPESCWHGIEEKGWGYMFLSVPADRSFTLYTAEVWAKCSSSIGTWYFKAWTVVNGQVVLTRNGVQLHSTSQADHGYKNLGLPPGGQARFRVTFAPEEGKAASCKFYLEAYKMDASVDSCMTAKECLDQLGDGSGAAFELRNGNSKQLKCLKSNEDSTMSATLLQKCTAWRQCVTRTGKKNRLLALMSAASTPAPGSLVTGVVTENITRDSDVCVHPAVDDPESWDCECAETMFAKCGDTDESCLQNLMCNNPGICDSWKQNHCLTSSSLMAKRSDKSAMINGIDNNLDGAMQGKCAEQ